MNDEEIRRLMNNDQAVTAATDMAKTTIAYWKELRRGGMTRGEALKLTTAYITTSILAFGGKK